MTRVYEVQMQITKYETVTIETEGYVSGEQMQELARKQLKEGDQTYAKVWFTRDMTPIPRTVKERVRTAFQKIRKQGAVARMNYMCCSSCGWAQLESDYPKYNDETDTAVFYHNQDAEAFDDFGNLAKVRNWNAGDTEPSYYYDKLYLAWSGDGTMIVNALQSQGLTVEWDGDANKRIAVTGVEEGSL